MTDLSQKRFHTIDSTEISISLPEELRGEDVTIKSEGDTEVLYRGSVVGLCFDGLNIRGNAFIQKIQRTKKKIYRKTVKVVGTRKLWGLIPINLYETESIGEELVNESVLLEAWAQTPHDWSGNYFVFWGKPNDSYWESIVGNAVNKGVILSPQLKSAIFGLIEQKLMGFYEQVKWFTSKP